MARSRATTAWTPARRPTSSRLLAGLALLAGASALVDGCGSQPVAEEARQAEPTGSPALAPAASPPVEQPGSQKVEKAEAEKAPPAAACGTEMALVSGNYCLTAEQRCVQHQDIPSGGGVSPNQCLRYAEPVVCYDERRRPMRFCMDRYEWPNRRGELPRVLVSWQDARDACAAAGKRLCTEEEFNFACEGESMRPYVYGFARDPGKCNFDRPYRPRTFHFLAWDACQADPACHAAFDAIDQRLPAGSMETCRSEQGIYDLNGNVNEWVTIPGARSPHRSGLKGGWWGPVRDRCRPTVTFHDEGDFGYEVGFRCCSDPAASAG